MILRVCRYLTSEDDKTDFRRKMDYEVTTILGADALLE